MSDYTLDEFLSGSPAGSTTEASENTPATSDGDSTPAQAATLAQEPAQPQGQPPQSQQTPTAPAQPAQPTEQGGQDAQDTSQQEPQQEQQQEKGGFDFVSYLQSPESNISEPLFKHEYPQLKPGETPPEVESSENKPWYVKEQEQAKQDLDGLRTNLMSPLEQAYQAIQQGVDPQQAMLSAAQQVNQLIDNEKEQRNQQLMAKYFETGAEREKTAAEKIKAQATAHANLSALAQRFGNNQEAFNNIMFGRAGGGEIIHYLFDSETKGRYPVGSPERDNQLRSWFESKAADASWLSMMADAARGRAFANNYPAIVQQLQRKWSQDFKTRSEKLGDQTVGRNHSGSSQSPLNAWLTKGIGG